MYYPETFFTKEVLKEALKQYKWPLQYKLQTTNSGSVLIKFPKCSILVYEGFESHMDACFLNEETGRNNVQSSLKLLDAVCVIRSTHNLSINDSHLLKGVLRFIEGEPSLEKVNQGLKNICILMQVYLLPCIEGDFSWVQEYNRQYNKGIY